MESLVSEEKKAILASWVPGASRWEGDWVFFSVQVTSCWKARYLGSEVRYLGSDIGLFRVECEVLGQRLECLRPVWRVVSGSRGSGSRVRYLEVTFHLLFFFRVNGGLREPVASTARREIRYRDEGGCGWLGSLGPEADPSTGCLQGEAGPPGRPGLAGRKGDVVSMGTPRMGRVVVQGLAQCLLFSRGSRVCQASRGPLAKKA